MLLLHVTIRFGPEYDFSKVCCPVMELKIGQGEATKEFRKNSEVYFASLWLSYHSTESDKHKKKQKNKQKNCWVTHRQALAQPLAALGRGEGKWLMEGQI